jgi:hypothetical protein
MPQIPEAPFAVSTTHMSGYKVLMVGTVPSAVPAAVTTGENPPTPQSHDKNWFQVYEPSALQTPPSCELKPELPGHWRQALPFMEETER